MRITQQAYDDLMSKRAKPKSVGKPQQRALGRLKPGQMNKTEAAYAAHLEADKLAGRILWWSFEGIKLRLAPNTSLTVDFAVLPASGILEMIDVKACKKGINSAGKTVYRPLVEDDAMAKIKIAADSFPFRFCLVWRTPVAAGGTWMMEEI